MRKKSNFKCVRYIYSTTSALALKQWMKMEDHWMYLVDEQNESIDKRRKNDWISILKLKYKWKSNDGEVISLSNLSI